MQNAESKSADGAIAASILHSSFCILQFLSGWTGPIGAGRPFAKRLGLCCALQVRILLHPLDDVADGEAPVCKAGHAGSIPAVVLRRGSSDPTWRGNRSRKPGGGESRLAGSNPAASFRTCVSRSSPTAEAPDSDSGRCRFESCLRHYMATGLR